MAETILKTEYSDVMQKSYIDYSMSVITARAVPAVRLEYRLLSYKK